MNGKKFKGLRLKEGLTQAEFGAMLNLSESAIANIEAGRRPVSAKVRARLAHRFVIDDKLLDFLDAYEKMGKLFPSKH